MRADHAVLIRSRRCPGRRCLIDIEATHGDIADTVLLRHKALAADSNLDIFLPRVGTLEVRVNNGLVLLRILFREPLEF